MNSRILFVDDEPNLLSSFQRSFRKTLQFDIAEGGIEALNAFEKNGAYAVIVSDMRMPGMDGMELLEKIKERYPSTVRVMLTGNTDQQTAVDAVNRGQIFRFLNKPCAPDDLLPIIHEALERYRLNETEQNLLSTTLVECVKVLAEILGMVAPDALGRGQRLSLSMQVFARFLKLPNEWELELGALLSGVGNASLPISLYRKYYTEGNVTPAESAVIREVPRIGYTLINTIPRLHSLAEIVLYQNKFFDGGGFPADGCAGSAIPLGARMLKILSDRTDLEMDGIVKKKAYEVMISRKGVYDVGLLDKCFLCFPDFLSQTISSERRVLSLPINRLEKDQVVVSDILSSSGTVLLSAGSKISEMILQRLNNHSLLNDVQQPVLVQSAT